MIKTEHEYLEAKKRIESEAQSIEKQKVKMREAGVSEDHITLAMEPLVSFSLQLSEEVEEYENLKRGFFKPTDNFKGIGRMLVALRISKGMPQKELAERIKVSEAQVSRDERNEYHNASAEKLQRVLDALDGHMIFQIVDAGKAIHSQIEAR